MNNKPTPAVIGLIIINIGIWLAVTYIDNAQWQAIQNKFMLLQKSDALGLHKGSGRPFHFLQPLGSAFNHSSPVVMHIALNMMALFFIGPAVERAMGTLRFIAFYFFCAIVGGFLGAFLSPLPNPSLGASGAICGVLVAFAWLYPAARLGVFPLPIYAKSRHFVLGFTVISVGLLIAQVLKIDLGFLSSLSHSGHLAGMIAAAIFLLGAGLLFGPKNKAI